MRGKGYEFDEKAERAVAGLIGSLPRVDAPGDFNARVWNRIEKGRAGSASGSLIFLRIAVPACLLLVLGGYFAYSTMYSRPTSPTVATSTEPKESLPVAAPTESQPSPEGDVASIVPPRSEKENPTAEAQPDKNRREQVPPRGSYDIGANKTANPILPRGFPQEPQLPDVNAPGTGREIAVKDILEMFGIRAEYKAGGWKVASVNPNNIAQKAGVLPGDIVEALNDQVLTDKTRFGRSFQGMSLRVRRNGQTLNLDLKP